MSTRLNALLGLVVLVSIGLLVACGSHYSATSDGLVIVPNRGSGTLQSFTLNLNNGSLSLISKAPLILGKANAVILDPSGQFAYVAVLPDLTVANSVTTVSIVSYNVNSDGSLTGANTVPMIGGDALNPSAFAIDSTGKFLFSANQATTDSEGTPVEGSVSVFSLSSGSLTEAPGSPFALPHVLGGALPSPGGLAVTPTVFPVSTTIGTATCSLVGPPTVEYLYVSDSANNQIFDFMVDGSTGALEPPLNEALVPGTATDRTPSGVAIDPCNRFVYVANHDSNNVSAYTICNATGPTCQNIDASLVLVGTPAPVGNGPTALAVDPFGNFVYVVNTLANSMSAFQISQVGGGLSPLGTPTVATGSTPVSIAIRSDGSWIFVTDNNSSGISQYAVTPASGALAALPGITTDNFPYGVAVK
jgi:6-phosphogluconolactonase (cycloisomerase 2 family)